MPTLRASELETLATQALCRAGADENAASITAQALVWADCRGLPTHGVARLPLYAAHLRNGRVDGHVRPLLLREKGAVATIDAQDGFAYPACRMASAEVMRRSREFGIGLVAVINSNHFGAAAWHLEPLAEAGLVSFIFGNSPAAIAPWGGNKALFGTNPIAASFPRRDAPPLVIDMSLTEVTRGKIMLAKQQKQAIPATWALDSAGQPTTDPEAALHGSLFPFGGAKGSMLALWVELLVTALCGAAFSADADSFFSETGNRPRIGQVLLAIDPAALAGSTAYAERMEELLAMMLAQPGTRVPGSRREEALVASAKGIDIAAALYAQLQALAAG